MPIGKAIGMKLYTQGVLVVGMSEIEGKSHMKIRNKRRRHDNRNKRKRNI